MQEHDNVIPDYEDGSRLDVKTQIGEGEYEWHPGTITDYQKLRTGAIHIDVKLDGQNEAIRVPIEDTRPAESVYGPLYGQIDHLMDKGIVVEVTYHRTKESFDRDVHERAYYGEPFTKQIYDAPKEKPVYWEDVREKEAVATAEMDRGE